MSIASALVSRWNDRGLDSSIKAIWPGSEDGPEQLALSGSTSKVDGDGGPPKETLPRARFVVMESEEMEKTASSKVFSQKFFIFMYAKSMDDLNDWSQLVKNAFENSHLSSTDPFSLDEGCVIHLDWVGIQSHPRYGDVKFVEIVFDCIYVIPRIFPS